MIISRDTEKAFHKIQHSFLIKNLSKLGIKRNFLRLTKNIKKLTADILLNCEQLENFLIRLGTYRELKSDAL